MLRCSIILFEPWSTIVTPCVITTITLPKWASQSPKGIPGSSPYGTMLDCRPQGLPFARFNETNRFAAPSVHPLRVPQSAPYDETTRFVLRRPRALLSCCTLVHRTPSRHSAEPVRHPGLRDPLLANSSQCTSQNQNPISPSPGNPSGQPAKRWSAPLNFNYTDNENLTRQPANQESTAATASAGAADRIPEIRGLHLRSGAPYLWSRACFGRFRLRSRRWTWFPCRPDYVIGPGDELRIRVWGQVNFRADVRVDRSGEIYLPQIGQVQVAGMPFSALDANLRAAIGRVYRNFDLTVDVGQIRAIQVYLAGEARRPGVYTVSSLSTLVDALFASGGPSAAGSVPPHRAAPGRRSGHRLRPLRTAGARRQIEGRDAPERRCAVYPSGGPAGGHHRQREKSGDL